MRATGVVEDCSTACIVADSAEHCMAIARIERAKRKTAGMSMAKAIRTIAPKYQVLGIGSQHWNRGKDYWPGC